MVTQTYDITELKHLQKAIKPSLTWRLESREVVNIQPKGKNVTAGTKKGERGGKSPAAKIQTKHCCFDFECQRSIGYLLGAISIVT